MNREQAKQLLPIIQAFADGAEVQFKDSRGEWVTASDDPGLLYGAGWRIKPKPREAWFVYSKSTGATLACCDNKAEAEKWLVSWGDRYVVHMIEVTE